MSSGALVEFLVFKFDKLCLNQALLVCLWQAGRANCIGLVTIEQKPLNEALVVDPEQDIVLINVILVALVANC